MTAVLELRGVTKTYGDHEVLAGIDLAVGEHEAIALIGASGSGKSTLLRCIDLLEEIDDGDIFLDGEPITLPGTDPVPIRRKLGLVFQAFNLFPHMKVIDNVTLGAIKAQRPPKDSVPKALATLILTGILGLRKPDPQPRGELRRALVTLLRSGPGAVIKRRRRDEVRQALVSVKRRVAALRTFRANRRQRADARRSGVASLRRRSAVLADARAERQRKAEAREAGLAILERFGLKDRANDYPDRLSGGQQQRVAIARALVTQPRALLLDEVTSALDPELVGEVLELISELKREGMTMVIATHEMEFARGFADQVCYLQDGKIIERGPPQQVLVNPQHPDTQRFLRRVLARPSLETGSETTDRPIQV